ncbi:hypothetical protein LSH36_61g05015, partial [Paralvinella palmiformis]
GEIVNWCGTSQSKLRHFKPQTQLVASSEMHCVILLLTHKETDWLSQTAEYTDGLCTLYGEIVESQGCSDNTKTGYWSRDLSTQDWIPIFRAYNGSGLNVYDAWNSTDDINMESDEGPSPLLRQPSMWPLIKEVTI